MPFLMIYGQELPKQVKADMAAEMTDAIARHYKVPPTMVSVFFVPLGPQDAFHAGAPLRDEGVDEDRS
jgi:phenylpyruvate tautomerase PptA (4-oxalocrotonate tautomerase family)